MTDDHKFKDSALYYRFVPDHQLVEEGRKSISSGSDTPTPKVDFTSIESVSCVRLLVRDSSTTNNYYKYMCAGAIY